MATSSVAIVNSVELYLCEIFQMWRLNKLFSSEIHKNRFDILY